MASTQTNKASALVARSKKRRGRYRPLAKSSFIALSSRKRGTKLLPQLADYLSSLGYRPVIDATTSSHLAKQAIGHTLEVWDKKQHQLPGLVIALGGDGSFIQAAQQYAPLGVPLTGINLGKLGFLTDISAEEMKSTLKNLLAGKRQEEKRLMLRAKLIGTAKRPQLLTIVNDLVLHRGEISALMSIDISIGEQHQFQIRADGIVVCTPSGSTAYGMSAGGPIIAPDNECMGLIPLNPHSLTQRPLVVGLSSTLAIKPLSAGRVYFDGQEGEALLPQEVIEIKSHRKRLIIWHPLGYNYYSTLRTKLFWNTG